jgi:hypothetical protein
VWTRWRPRPAVDKVGRHRGAGFIFAAPVACLSVLASSRSAARQAARAEARDVLRPRVRQQRPAGAPRRRSSRGSGCWWSTTCSPPGAPPPPSSAW